MSSYTVYWGYCGRRCEGFDTFESALACYRELLAEEGAEPRLFGRDCDPGDDDGVGASDGLTESEREQIAELEAA